MEKNITLEIIIFRLNGSFHKFTLGYNSHNGFYNLTDICKSLIQIVENSYGIKLPNINHWFLQRIDIAICFDLKNQKNIKNYINNLSCCNFPRRNLKHYEDESIYLTGSTTTLKIYNKMVEFKKHDLSNFLNTDFDLVKYLDTINGYIRFECEIKKKKLKYIFNKNFIRVTHVTYSDLKRIWYNEFSKFLKNIETDYKKISDRQAVKTRLYLLYTKARAKHLYDFYILILAEGLKSVKENTNRSMYYKNIADLKKANIDFSQKFNIDMEDNRIDFNPFESDEIP